jgi:formyltetrahydrofolate synthetase
MRCLPTSIDKAARVRKYDELGWLRVYDDLGGLNVGDSLWRRIINLNYRRFLSRLRVGWGNCGDGTVRRTGAGITPRSDLLIVQLRRESPGLLHCFR